MLHGRPIQIEGPEGAERRRKSAAWETRATLNLAKAALQNGETDKAVYLRIASHLRMLALQVPESEWAEIEWCDGEE